MFKLYNNIRMGRDVNKIKKNHPEYKFERVKWEK